MEASNSFMNNSAAAAAAASLMNAANKTSTQHLVGRRRPPGGGFLCQPPPAPMWRKVEFQEIVVLQFLINRKGHSAVPLQVVVVDHLQ